jgi:hypothetical protein
MRKEIDNSTTYQLDGFGGFTDAVEGIDAQLMSSVSLLGLKLKYLAPLWTDPDEQQVKALLVVHDIQRKVQKWLDGRPVETIILGPGQAWPDIEKMNAECPQSEWREVFNKMQGPYQGEHVVLFYDPDTMVRYWWPSPITTVGSAICVRELAAQTQLKRRVKGDVQVYPLVELSHTFMPTGFGPRERPSLVVKDWVLFGEGGSVVSSTPSTPALPSTAPTGGAAPAATNNPSGMQSVGPLTAKEATDDEIPY